MTLAEIPSNISMILLINVDVGGVNVDHEIFPDAVHFSTRDDGQTALMNHTHADNDDDSDASDIAWQMDAGVDARSVCRKNALQYQDEGLLD